MKKSRKQEVLGYDGQIIACNFTMKRQLSSRKVRWLKRKVGRAFGNNGLAQELLQRVLETNSIAPRKPNPKVAGDGCQVYNAIHQAVLGTTWLPWLSSRIARAQAQLRE